MPDGAQRDVEVETRGDDEHGFDQPVEAIAPFDELVDAVLHLGEQFPQPQPGQSVAQGTWSADSSGPTGSVTPAT